MRLSTPRYTHPIYAFNQPLLNRGGAPRTAQGERLAAGETNEFLKAVRTPRGTLRAPAEDERSRVPTRGGEVRAGSGEGEGGQRGAGC